MGYGKYIAVCKYHLRYTGSACARERAILGPTLEDRNDKLREMHQWCLNSILYTHQRDHIRDENIIELILPFEIQDEEGAKLPPMPDPILRDDEIDERFAADLAEVDKKIKAAEAEAKRKKRRKSTPKAAAPKASAPKAVPKTKTKSSSSGSSSSTSSSKSKKKGSSSSSSSS